MISYVKIWTAIFNDEWFVSLPLNGRGLWLQLLVWGKMVGDSGQIVGKSRASIGQAMGTDGRTFGRLIDNFATDGKVVIEKGYKGGIIITIVNYQYWQGLKSGKGLPKPGKGRATMVQTDDKNVSQLIDKRTNKIIDKRIEPPDESGHKSITTYFCDKHLEVFKIKYDFKGSKDGSTVKKLLKTYDVAMICRMIDLFFASQDEFVLKAGHTIGVLSSQSNKLAQEIAQPGRANVGSRSNPSKFTGTPIFEGAEEICLVKNGVKTYPFAGDGKKGGV